MLFQPVRESPSICCGVFLKKGSANEQESEAGYFHLLEHLLFRKTKTRSARDIFSSIEKIGGTINGFTTKEFTGYYVSLISEGLSIALDILSDMICNPKFQKKDLELEKKIILDEIQSYLDNPDEFFHLSYYNSFLNNHPLGRCTGGTKESILSAQLKVMETFYETHYQPENLILAIAGNADWKSIQNLTEKYFLKSFQKKPKLQESEKNSSEPIQKQFIKNFHPKKQKQVQFYLGAEGVERNHEQNTPLSLACSILGGGPSSILFRELREKQGLCYSISCYSSNYHQTGLSTIYCSVKPENLSKVLTIIFKKIEKILKKGFQKEELEAEKGAYIGSLAMGIDSMEGRMLNLALQEIYYQKIHSLQEKVQFISELDIETVNKAFQDSFGLDKYHLSLMGALSKREIQDLPHSI